LRGLASALEAGAAATKEAAAIAARSLREGWEAMVEAPAR
jgi:hypothetical protein